MTLYGTLLSATSRDFSLKKHFPGLKILSFTRNSLSFHFFNSFLLHIQHVSSPSLVFTPTSFYSVTFNLLRSIPRTSLTPPSFLPLSSLLLALSFFPFSFSSTFYSFDIFYLKFSPGVTVSKLDLQTIVCEFNFQEVLCSKSSCKVAIELS